MVLEELISILGFRYEGEGELNRFKGGLGSADSAVKRFATGVGVAAAGIAAGMAAIAASATAIIPSMFALASSAAKPLDALEKSADKVGLSVEALQEWRFAAEQAAGVSSQTFDMAMQRFSRRIGEAANGTGALKDTIKALGIPLKDSAGNVRSLESILDDYGKAISNAGSEQERLRLAFKAFDSEGAALVNLFKDKGVAEELRKVARETGLVFTKQDTERAVRYNDQLDLLTKTISAIKTRIGLDLIPGLTEMMDLMQGWLNQHRDAIREQVSGFFLRMTEHFRTMGRALVRLSENSKLFYASIAGIGLAFALAFPKLALFGAALLAADDILTWWAGGDSVIGLVIEKLHELAAAFGLTRENTGFQAASDNLAKMVKDADELGKSLGKILTDFDVNDPEAFAKMFGPLKDILMKEMSEFSVEFKPPSWMRDIKQYLIDQISGFTLEFSAPEWMRSLGRFLSGAAQNILAPATAAASEAPRATFSERFSGAAAPGVVTTNSNNTTNVQVNMTVNAQSNDGAGLGAEAARALDNELRKRALTIHGSSPVTP